MTQFVCLSGLPRSGSTLLSSILSQNPLIHAEGNSAVCQLMWDMYISFTKNAYEQLKGNYKDHLLRDFIIQIPNTYYKNILIGTEVIIDKCRAWIKPTNIELLKMFIDSDIKIIVMERSVTDIMKSFYKLYKNNNWSDEMIRKCFDGMLMPGSEPIMASLESIKLIKDMERNRERKRKRDDVDGAGAAGAAGAGAAGAAAGCSACNNSTFLFINYENLVEHPDKVIEQIYDFCGWQSFQHTFEGIVNKYPENDAFYGLEGFHNVRPTICKEDNCHVVLPDDIMKKCNEIDKLFGY